MTSWKPPELSTWVPRCGLRGLPALCGWGMGISDGIDPFYWWFMDVYDGIMIHSLWDGDGKFIRIYWCFYHEFFHDDKHLRRFLKMCELMYRWIWVDLITWELTVSNWIYLWLSHQNRCSIVTTHLQAGMDQKSRVFLFFEFIVLVMESTS